MGNLAVEDTVKAADMVSALTAIPPQDNMQRQLAHIAFVDLVESARLAHFCARRYITACKRERVSPFR